MHLRPSRHEFYVQHDHSWLLGLPGSSMDALRLDRRIDATYVLSILPFGSATWNLGT